MSEEIVWKRIDSEGDDATSFYFSEGGEGFQIVTGPGRFPALYRWGVRIKNYPNLQHARRAAQTITDGERVRLQGTDRESRG